jgi:integrase
LHPLVIAALTALPHREGEVFLRPDGKPYERPAASDNWDTSAGSRIKTAFRGACRRTGIEDFHPHDCRHTWATSHYRENRDLGALQKLGGWKTLSMVMRYAHTNVAEHAHTINKLPGGTSLQKGEFSLNISKVLAHPSSLGKGEAESSILSRSTTKTL